MALQRISDWKKLPVTLAELCIDTTLRCGQSFRWRKINDEWRCTLYGRILSLRQDSSHLHYRVTWPEKPLAPSGDDTEALLRNYFNLGVNLENLYRQWSKADPNFRKKAPEFTGVRILNQDGWEALIAFICSSNNNISRISQMVHKLCNHYGPFIGHIDDEAYYDFPSPSALIGPKVESHLRELGFGYRAKYIAETARIIAKDKHSGWLDDLRNPEVPGFGTSPAKNNHASYKDAHEELLTLKGVGPKVADCVCLMGLGWGESVPVDTHVWQIAQRDYKFGGKKSKTFNKAMYDAVGDHFRGIWGTYAGWAHSVLFTADLREFANQVTKKEETLKVEIKEEAVTENILQTTSRKRRTVTETRVKSEVKLEEGGGGPVTIVERTTKKRRTRAS